jgi:ribosomal protein L29
MAKRKKKEKEVGPLKVEDLELQAGDLEKQIFALRNELAMNRKLERPHLLKTLRHQRARLLTQITAERKKQNV